MSRIALLTVLMFGSIVSAGQNISVTFTGTGAATQIDSVTATNLKTNESITLPGNETLVVGVNTGIPAVPELAGMGIVYPNPFSGRATFITIVSKAQTVYLKVQNLAGQVVAQTQSFVQPGENVFTLSVNAAGIYMVSLTTEQGTVCYKVICNEAIARENSVQYLGTGAINDKNPSRSGQKSSLTRYTIGYQVGDVILYRCRSGIYTTILTDTPATSKNYEIVFAACTDPDGKNYSVVKIGNQTWMAENMAYLPVVSPSSVGSDTTSYYYVYDYEGDNLIDAKAGSNYSTYGVLYNWPAALSACPTGWHLPTDDEWKILEKNQGMSESDANDFGWRISGSVGGKLKESGTSHWSDPNIGAANTSGFAVLPGGFRNVDGGFGNLGGYALLWSASDSGSSSAWGRALGTYVDGVGRYDYVRGDGFSVRCLRN